MFVELGDTLYVVKGNHSPTTGTLTDPSSSSAKWHEDGGAGSTTGVTVTSPFDSVTGQIKVAVVCSSGNGFELGKRYSLMLYTTTGGVDSAAEIANFQIVAAQSVAGYPEVTTTLGAGSITSSTFAAGAITATTIAADAIGASELAADAAAEIADAVWDEVRSGHTTVGTFGEGINVVTIAVAAAQTIRDAVLTYVLDNTGAVPATVKGALRRIDLAVSGKATGLKGAIARFFKRDGITQLWSLNQDTRAGTRSGADLTDSES